MKKSYCTTKEVGSVRTRAKELGFNEPVSICILPRRFFLATERDELFYEASSQDVKLLAQEVGIHFEKMESEGSRIPYQSEHASTWVGPMIFIAAQFWAEYPELCEMLLNKIIDYVKAHFLGEHGHRDARLSMVLERSDGTNLQINYEGPVDSIDDIRKLVKEAYK